jgi:hypothetical protein
VICTVDDTIYRGSDWMTACPHVGSPHPGWVDNVVSSVPVDAVKSSQNDLFCIRPSILFSIGQS